MLVALILVTYTFTIHNAGRTLEILFVFRKVRLWETFQRCGVMKPDSSGHFHLAVLAFLVRERVCVPKSR
jgi:hypothetical protein